MSDFLTKNKHLLFLFLLLTVLLFPQVFLFAHTPSEPCDPPPPDGSTCVSTPVHTHTAPTISTDTIFMIGSGNDLNGEQTTPYATIGEGGSGNNSANTNETEDQNGEDDCESGSVNSAGNPINFLTGNKYQTEYDFRGGGMLPLEIRRTYNSNTILNRDFGYRWSTNTLFKSDIYSQP